MGCEAVRIVAGGAAWVHRIWEPSVDRCVPEQLVSVSLLAFIKERFSPVEFAGAEFACEHLAALLHAALAADRGDDLETHTPRMDQPKTRSLIHLLFPHEGL